MPSDSFLTGPRTIALDFWAQLAFECQRKHPADALHLAEDTEFEAGDRLGLHAASRVQQFLLTTL